MAKRKTEEVESKDATFKTLTGDSKSRGGGGFPLDEGHYFSLPLANRRSHSGGADAQHIMAIQRALSITPTGQYDYATMMAVGEWQRNKGREVTNVVDRETWEGLFSK